jgi:hypothetical protein
MKTRTRPERPLPGLIPQEDRIRRILRDELGTIDDEIAALRRQLQGTEATRTSTRSAH